MEPGTPIHLKKGNYQTTINKLQTIPQKRQLPNHNEQITNNTLKKAITKPQ